MSLKKESIIAITDFEKLEIHGPQIIGTTPNKPFFFLIPATGSGTILYRAENLPENVTLDQKTGIISGIISSPGIFQTKISVSDSHSTIKKPLTIVAGSHKLALTPPMGWNSWNIWANNVTDANIRQAADAMIDSKLSAFGYQYINIDDTWECKRDEKGNITSNKRFPNMKELGDYLHFKGLKFGIYSSPGPKTCGNYEGSWGHEEQDALRLAEWGVDFLKYDWCSYGKIAKKSMNIIPHFFYDDHFYSHNIVPVKELIKPYQKMREALDKTNRNIVYSLCPITLHGKYNPSQWGPKVGADLWRTSGDIKDNWLSMSNIGFRQYKYYHSSGAGYWNDPDMLVIGKVSCDKEIHSTHLTQIEQITHITLWTILAAPLIIGCDLTQLDEFTLNLLTNSEVIDVDQDSLGHIGKRLIHNRSIEIYMKPLSDGTIAVAVFNRSKKEKQFSLQIKKLGIHSEIKVRDLWLKKDMGSFRDEIPVTLPSHGSFLFKIHQNR